MSKEEMKFQIEETMKNVRAYLDRNEEPSEERSYYEGFYNALDFVLKMF